tara:strand:- start:521 stop:1051 length:531 start_codon:yes stop_codon:yes gene_type:complete
MNTNVTVVVDEKTGLTVRPSKKNPEFSYVVIEQMAPEIKQGWVSTKKLTNLVQGPTKSLLELEKKGFFNTLTGKIIVLESLEPFNEKMPHLDLKMAGDTGVVCMVGDKPIYRVTDYVYDLNKHSEFIKHTNGADIRAVQAGGAVSAQATPEAVQSLDAFTEAPIEAEVVSEDASPF